MRKGIKAGFPMIGTHAAGADTAESHVAGSQMQESIVDTSAAETAVSENTVGGAWILRKQIQCQRVWMLFDDMEHFL